MYENEFNDQFNSEQIQYNIALKSAELNKTTIVHEYCKGGIFGALKDPHIWPNPYEEEAEDAAYSEVNLVDYAGKNPLSNYCAVISEAIQFPINTAFLHGMGVVSSAMNMRFKYDYHGEHKPTNLYIVTAQPPSTGKSGINSKLSTPVRNAYNEVAKANRVYRAASEKTIIRLEREIEASPNDMASKHLIEELVKEQEFLDSKPEYIYAVDDATPEALESMASKQGGLFNVISDEADAINVLMGNVYAKGGKSNHGIFLKGWDGDYLSAARITRDTSPGYVRGTIAVIAQDESIDSILEAGRSGRGVSERILMLREKSKLGTRIHGERKEIPQKLKDAYTQMIDNIVGEQEDVVLSFSSEAMADIDDYRNVLEPYMLDGEKFANRMITGVVGKADKQILKLASVLHACEHWTGKCPKKKLQVEQPTIQRAIQIFNLLINTFVDAADSKGFVGEQTELRLISDWIAAYKEKTKGNKSLPIRKLRDGIKNKDVFVGTPALTKKLKTEYLPALEKRGVLVFDSKNVFINPKL